MVNMVSPLPTTPQLSNTDPQAHLHTPRFGRAVKEAREFNNIAARKLSIAATCIDKALISWKSRPEHVYWSSDLDEYLTRVNDARYKAGLANRLLHEAGLDLCDAVDSYNKALDAGR
jgi:hypothetical protein